MTKVCPVYHVAKENPDRTALRLDENCISYAALDKHINEAVVSLTSYGVNAGMRIGLYLQRSPQYIIVLWALFRLKAVAVPLNTRLPKSAALDQLRSVNTHVCITDLTNNDWPDEPDIQLIDVLIPGLQSGTSTHALTANQTFEIAQPATILFTSGSSGKAKGVLHTWGNHYYSALGSNENIVLGDEDTWLLSLPLYHVAGVSVLFRCFLAGASIAISNPEKSIYDALADAGVSHVSLVATQLQRLLEATEEKVPSSIKALLVGGSTIPASLIRRAHYAGWPIHTTYGMTEMASQVTTTSPNAMLEERLTAGRVLSYRKITISSESEICVGGRVCFAGYVKGNVVSPVLDHAGYYHTGDLGYIDGAGLLHIKGRRDNMFISGGENIYPEEIENALNEHPDIDRAVVVPVPDHDFGFRPTAFVEVGHDSISSEEISAFLARKLPRYMLPVAYHSLMETEGMKVSRLRLAEIAAELTKRD